MTVTTRRFAFFLTTLIGLACIAGAQSRRPALPPHTAGNSAQNATRPVPRVQPGIDVLRAHNFRHLEGKRVGILTNPSGVDSRGVPSWKVLHEAPQVRLTALFAPEHGIDGTIPANEYIESRTHPLTGLPVFSLYGATRAPNANMLERIDILLIDLQDVGSRSYTYISAMKRAMEACFAAGKEVMILDRPNPLGGTKVTGPPLDKEYMSYVGDYQIPYVHGLTMAELALMAKNTPGWLNITEAERTAGKLYVVPMDGWQRNMIWTDTGLTWVAPSPNVPSFGAALGYSMTGLGAQVGAFTHGIGTPFPFRLLRYPGKSATQLAAELNALHIPGLEFKPIRTESVRTKQPVEGAYIVVTNWSVADPARLSLEMMRLTALWEQQAGKPNPFTQISRNQADLFNKHVGSAEWWQAITRQGANVNIPYFLNKWNREAAAFRARSQLYWLYR